MDPNAALKSILDNVMYFFSQESPDETIHQETIQEEHARVMEICEQFNALHYWLMNGGFLPNKWQQMKDKDE